MTVADDLEAARAALEMINPAPYNAEAPPEALAGDITPTELHYVRSNFARARRTTAPWRSAAPSSNPTTLTLDDLRAMPAHEQAVTLECAGNGRLDDEAAADRRAVGRLRRLDRPLDRRPAARRARAGAARRPTASTSGSRAPTTAPTTCSRSSRRPTRTTSPSSARCRSPRRPIRRRRS